ncbi:MAG: (5-formylfuran-3-yl)methyl phosphate synthase [Candidatus Hermodarchaeota archaeon]
MKLLVSPINLSEARECVQGGADIVDVKNPAEGSLGAGFPWVIKEIRRFLPPELPLSAALGDVSFKPGTIALASLGLASCGVQYIKVGLHGICTLEEGIQLMKPVVETVKSYSNKIQIVAAGYADAKRIEAIKPYLIPEVGRIADCDLIMLDTAIKDGLRLFDHCKIDFLEKFVQRAHEQGQQAALAGSLRKEDLKVLAQIKTDIAGVRGAACSNSDRNQGTIQSSLIRELRGSF